MWNFRDGLNVAGGVYASTIPSGYKRKTWRGLAGIGEKRHEDPEYGEYQYGYGIEDYSRVIRVLSFRKAEVDARRESYERLGFYTALEIEELLEASGALFCAARDHGRQLD